MTRAYSCRWDVSCRNRPCAKRKEERAKPTGCSLVNLGWARLGFEGGILFVEGRLEKSKQRKDLLERQHGNL